MIHLIRLFVFSALFFIGYKLYPYIWANEVAKEVCIAAGFALIVVIFYAVYENWEKKDERTDIRKGSG